MTSRAILFVGQTVPGSRTFQRINAFKELGHSVEVIPTNLPGARYEDKPSLSTRIRYRLRMPKDSAEAGQVILDGMRASKYDVLWLERAVEIGPKILQAAKEFNPALKIVWYAEDDMMNIHHRSRQVEAAMPYYDLWVTTKSFNARPEEVPSFGVKNILFVNNSYDATLHQPVAVSDQDRIDFGADISFVGTHAKHRAESLVFLTKQGVSVRVWGNGWAGMKDKVAGLMIENRPVYDDDYIKVISASKINLCFLRKENRDLQTCRSIEIPACGGFMLHERKAEMKKLLIQNQQADYFKTNQELLEQCNKWLAADQEREAVAAEGFGRVSNGSFSHTERLQEILAEAFAPSQDQDAS